jgi:hypothetical protein
LTPQAFPSNGYNIYTSSLANNHEFGTAFLVDSKFNHMVKNFEVVKEFVYLESLMTPTNDVSLEIQRRIHTANRCFFGLRKHLQSSHLSSQTKFTIHKTLIHPVLLYGSET